MMEAVESSPQQELQGEYILVRIEQTTFIKSYFLYLHYYKHEHKQPTCQHLKTNIS